jgi:hypothetical protein
MQGKGGMETAPTRAEMRCFIFVKIFHDVDEDFKNQFFVGPFQRGFSTKRPSIVFFWGPTKPLPSYD